MKVNNELKAVGTRMTNLFGEKQPKFIKQMASDLNISNIAASKLAATIGQYAYGMRTKFTIC